LGGSGGFEGIWRDLEYLEGLRGSGGIWRDLEGSGGIGRIG